MASVLVGDVRSRVWLYGGVCLAYAAWLGTTHVRLRVGALRRLAIPTSVEFFGLAILNTMLWSAVMYAVIAVVMRWRGHGGSYAVAEPAAAADAFGAAEPPAVRPRQRMTEAEVVAGIRAEMAGKEHGSKAFRLLKEGLLDHPESPRLWCLRGDLIQLADDGLPLEESLRSYREARTASARLNRSGEPKSHASLKPR